MIRRAWRAFIAALTLRPHEQIEGAGPISNPVDVPPGPPAGPPGIAQYPRRGKR